MADDVSLRDPLDMTGRTVIVTGGTKGLGRAISERFLQQGADVVICARREPETPVEAGRRSAMFVACDVREPEQIAAVVAAAVDATGRVDVLVNNAGGAPPADSATVSPRFNEKIVALNLMAPLSFAQAVHDQMQSQDNGGVIINIASVSGTRANPAGVAYGAAKAGLINATATLAVEWGPKIRVIAPVVGLIVTDEAHLFYGDDAGIAAVGDTLALGRMGVPEEVADVVLFCASPLARWVSGCTIPVHGGGDRPSYLGASTGEVAQRP
jgi:NAD(P)-dependent dehydrogenase (short-subunit alcohol dehydrogenase family)